MGKSSIEWTQETWNPVVGCQRVSPGCEHCYAETMAGRLARMGQARYLDVVKLDDKGRPRGRWNGTFREVPEALAIPLRRRKPTTYFVNSMSDLFGEGVTDEYIAAVFGVMAACPQHTFQVLTKRAERMAGWFERAGHEDASFIHSATASRTSYTGAQLKAFRPKTWPLPNAWIGVSVEDQQRADERIPHLLRVPAAVRFLSVEPMLGPVNLHPWLCAGCGDDLPCSPRADGIGWVIVGGESGHGARPFDLAWARSIVEQCKAAGVAVFYKQGGSSNHCEHSNKGGCLDCMPPDLQIREWPNAVQGS